MRWRSGVISSLFLLLCINVLSYSFSGEMLSYSDPSFCKNDEYFNALQMKCELCDSTLNLEPTDDKLSCTCNSWSKIVNYDSTGFPKCELCPSHEFSTSDQMSCLPCANYTAKGNNSLVCEVCSSNQIQVERYLNGSTSEIHCLNCMPGTTPSIDGKSCVPCFLNLPANGGKNCSCPLQTQELLAGKCIPRDSLADWPDERNTFLIKYASGINVDSSFFRTYLRSSVHLCKLKNQTACQMVANMCTMAMFRDDYKGSPCKLFQNSKHIPTSETGNFPWLFYGEGDAQTVLHRKKINTRFSLDSKSLTNHLNLTVARFSPEGHLRGLSVATGSFLQVCPGSWAVLNAGLRFGSHYHHSCQIPASQLMEHRDTEFLDLYLQYWEGGESLLYAVPILTLNVKGGKNHNNKASDSSQWTLVRRFFLIDKISGVKSVLDKQKEQLEEAVPSMIRYLKFCQLRVRVQGPEEEGRIYPPLLVIEYGEISREDIEAGNAVSLTFSVDYEMPNSLPHAIEVSMGVLSALAVVWSGIETWSCSRRSGRVTIDLLTLTQLALHTCGNLATVFFLVVASASFHTFAFYKGQSVVQVLLPTDKHEELIKKYIIAAFTLKVVEIVHLIWKQISIDIFFIDWERPRARSSTGRPQNQVSNASGDSVDQPVSIWRMYFVANEWNEIQTKRKISLLFQLSLTIFILKIVGNEHWATADPELHTTPPEYMASSPPSMMCRFAVGVVVYLTVYLFQWLFMIGIYERYVKNGIQEFVDICSMANISVFILSLENYGFYIHGRSAHGFADTDMQTILGQLQREEEDLCGHRGLVPGTDQQTFQMAVPHHLRTYYRKVMMPISSIMQSTKRLSMAGAGGGLRTKMASGNVDRSVQAYHNMNKFLAAFLEHALKDLDYEVREKLFVESLLDIEFTEALDRGIFYADNGHSFDNILFYGNEFTLATFDILLFSFIEILSQDFLLAAILTAAVAKVLVMIRNIGGRRNLAKKTLIDERFLI